MKNTIIIFVSIFFLTSCNEKQTRQTTVETSELPEETIKTSTFSSEDLKQLVVAAYNSTDLVAPPKDYGDGFEVVFVEGGTRYTLYASHADTSRFAGGGFLSIFARPEGSTAKSVYSSYMDQSLDGSVDLAYKGENNEQLFTSSDYSSEPQGQEYKEKWQKKFDNAVKNSLKHFKVKLPSGSRTLAINS